jgi:hypothetical protein
MVFGNVMNPRSTRFLFTISRIVSAVAPELQVHFRNVEMYLLRRSEGGEG